MDRLADQLREEARARETAANPPAAPTGEAPAVQAAEAAEAKRAAEAEAKRQAELSAAREASMKAEAELAAMGVLCGIPTADAPTISA